MAGSMMEALQEANLATPQMIAADKQREENRQVWAQGQQKALAVKSAKTEQAGKKKKSFKPTQGVCPECQSSQAIRNNPEFSERDEQGHFKLTDPEDRYVLVEHEKFGCRCEGSGQIPEKLIWEKK